jgi:hypothetical protein
MGWVAAAYTQASHGAERAMQHMIFLGRFDQEKTHHQLVRDMG